MVEKNKVMKNKTDRNNLISHQLGARRVKELGTNFRVVFKLLL